MFEEIMGDLDNLGGAIGGFLGGTGGQLIGAGLSIDELNKITDIAQRSAAEQARIGREAQEASAFRPFTVSTGFGGIQATPEGGFTTSLSPAQAAQQQQLQAITSGLLGGMGGMGGGFGQSPALLAQDRQQRPALQPNRFSYGPQFMTDNRDGTPRDRSSEFANLTPERLQKAEEERQKYLQERGGEDTLNLAGDIYNFVAKQPGDIGYITNGRPVRPLITTFQPSMSPEEAMAARISGVQPPQAPMTPATGGFGSGIPDVSGITGQALGGVTGALTGLMAPMGQREADVYERIRATQRPEEERARLALEERLQSQGRTGLRTAQFGGAPEQLALAQAQEEAKARASLGALGQAQAEQMQQLGIAQGLFGLGSGAAALPASLQGAQLGNIGAAMGLQYLPEQQLLATLDPAINLANIAGVGQRQGAGYLTQAGISGLEDILQAETVRSQNLRDIYSSILGAQSAQQQAAGQAATNTGLFSSIGNIGSALLDFFR